MVQKLWRILYFTNKIGGIYLCINIPKSVKAKFRINKSSKDTYLRFCSFDECFKTVVLPTCLTPINITILCCLDKFIIIC